MRSDGSNLTRLTRSPGHDAHQAWSPDGQWIAFTSAGGDTVTNFYKNNQLMKVPASGGSPVRLATDFDEQIGGVMWTPQGSWFLGFDKTFSKESFGLGDDDRDLLTLRSDMIQQQDSSGSIQSACWCR